MQRIAYFWYHNIQVIDMWPNLPKEWRTLGAVLGEGSTCLQLGEMPRRAEAETGFAEEEELPH